MTIFSDNLHDRRIERFMTAIPNFKPRGVGVRFSESQVLSTITAATPTEILAETMRQIRCPPFQKRFNEYIESEEKPMTYINEKHRAIFTLAAKNISKTNYALLSVLYLLTVKGCLPADDADDPKYAEFGRELIRSGKGIFTEHGLFFADENTPFQ